MVCEFDDQWDDYRKLPIIVPRHLKPLYRVYDMDAHNPNRPSLRIYKLNAFSSFGTVKL